MSPVRNLHWIDFNFLATPGVLSMGGGHVINGDVDHRALNKSESPLLR